MLPTNILPKFTSDTGASFRAPDLQSKTAYGTFGRSKFLPVANTVAIDEKLRRDARDPAKLREKTLVQSLDKWDNEYKPKFGKDRFPLDYEMRFHVYLSINRYSPFFPALF